VSGQVGEETLGDRQRVVRHGKVLEYLSFGLATLEAIFAIGAGALAQSIALTGFGLDSVIEA